MAEAGVEGLVQRGVGQLQKPNEFTLGDKVGESVRILYSAIDFDLAQIDELSKESAGHLLAQLERFPSTVRQNGELAQVLAG